MASSTGAADARDSTSPNQSRIPSPHRPGKQAAVDVDVDVGVCFHSIVPIVPPLPFAAAGSCGRIVANTSCVSIEAKPESKLDTAPRHDAAPSTTTATAPTASNAEPAKPLAPPPRPAQSQPSGNTPELFSFAVNSHLNLEPNPFEQSFSGAPETPGGTKLPPVASITSPSSLLPGGGTTPFPWGSNSLRTGPLSPAMLSGPTSDYFSNDHIRNGFPTPTESNLRTGLTPGGSGSMFPVPSPNTQLYGGGPSATPGALEFHRAALSISAAKREHESRAQAQAQAQQAVTSQPQTLPHETKTNGGPPVKNDTKPSTGSFDPHDNDAANGLYMLARGQNGGTVPPTQQYPANPPQHIQPQSHPGPQATSTSPQMNGNVSITGSSARGVSEALSAISDDSELARPNTRGKNKRNSGGGQTNSRRKAEDSAGKGPAAKKSKTNGGMPSFSHDSFEMDDHSDLEDDMKINKDGTKTKMTEEEKRKNFLERNRYVRRTLVFPADC